MVSLGTTIKFYNTDSHIMRLVYQLHSKFDFIIDQFKVKELQAGQSEFKISLCQKLPHLCAFASYIFSDSDVGLNDYNATRASLGK